MKVCRNLVDAQYPKDQAPAAADSPDVLKAFRKFVQLISSLWSRHYPGVDPAAMSSDWLHEVDPKFSYVHRPGVTLSEKSAKTTAPARPRPRTAKAGSEAPERFGATHPAAPTAAREVGHARRASTDRRSWGHPVDGARPDPGADYPPLPPRDAQPREREGRSHREYSPARGSERKRPRTV